MAKDKTRLHELLDIWHSAAHYEGTGYDRLSEIMEICYERARVTGFRQRLRWNCQFKAWEVVSLTEQPI